jgi:hypothetical protein
MLINIKFKIKYMKTIILIMFITLFNLNVNAQQAIDSSGGDATGINGKASYSIGQVVFTANSGTNGSVIQGVQQPYEISIVLGSEVVKGINLQLSVFPNPTSDFITLEVKDYDFQILNYQLYDITGKEFLNAETDKETTKIEIGNLPPAIYFLKIIDSKKEIKTFKIIKNN